MSALAAGPSSAEPLVQSDSASAVEPEQRQVYTVEEYGNVNVPLADLLDGDRLQLHPEVEAKGYFNVRLKGTNLQLQAGGYIGLIALNDRVAIDVRPRVPVSNLARMLQLSGQAPIALKHISKSYQTEEGSIEPLLDIYSDALAGAVDAIQQRGLYRTYEQRREVTSFPHGRILVDETVKRLLPRAIHHKVSASWYQRTADNPPNQCLKYAIWYLSARYARIRTKPARSREIQRHLNRAFRVFDGVTLDLGRSFLRDHPVSGHTRFPPPPTYYRDALDLGVAIALQQAVALDREGHNLRLSSLILNMNDVFESYLRVVLRTQSQLHGWPGRVLDGNSAGGKLLFDERPSVPANPDIVVATTGRRTQRFPLIIDAKYKPAPETPDRDDINQIVTYGLSYRSPKVVLAYPRGRSPRPAGLDLLGMMRPVAVYRYTFDLGAMDLSKEERTFADAMHEAAFGPGPVGTEPQLPLPLFR